jgi:PAS domain S-box-containing protein
MRETAISADSGPLLELERLRERLREVEETLEAIRSGEVDALVVNGPQGEQVYTLAGADRAYRFLVETMNEGAATLASDGTILYANGALGSLLRTELERIVGSAIHEYVATEDEDRLRSLLELGAARSSRGEVRLRAADGAVVPASLSVRRLEVEEDVPAVVAVLTDLSEQKRAQDELRGHRLHLKELVDERTAELKRANEQLQQEITERKRAEQALRKSERQLAVRNRIANIFLTIPDEQMYAEVLRVILEASESKYGVFGYLDDEGNLVCPSMTREVWDQCRVPGKNVVFPRDTWGGIWGRALREKKTFYSNEPLRVPEGHIPISRALAVPIVHQDQAIGVLEAANKPAGYDEKDLELVETIADSIAPILAARLQRDRQEKERKRAEEELRLAKEKLEEANRLKDEFLSLASHELKTPVTSLKIYCELAARRPDKLEPRLTATLVRQADQLVGLVNDLLDVSRLQLNRMPLETGPLDLAGLVGELCERRRPFFEERLVSCPLKRDEIVVEGDALRLEQVFSNLLDNAVKYSANGSRIQLRVRRRAGKAVVEVRDEGIGIPAEHLPHIFERFYKPSSQQAIYHGLGVGLYICKEIVERHGGRIWTESKPGKGSTFYVELPLAESHR